MTIAFTQNELNLKISIVTKVTEHFVNSDDFGPFFTLLYDIGTLMFSKEMSQIACINLNIKEALFLPQFSDEEPPPLLSNGLKSTILVGEGKMRERGQFI